MRLLQRLHEILERRRVDPVLQFLDVQKFPYGIFAADDRL